MRPLIAMFCLALLAAGLVTSSALAEDEGSPSSVYLVFDAETGELVQVDDPSRKRNHVADQEAIASGTSPTGPAAGKSLDPKIASGVGLILLLLFGIAWLRRSRGNPDSDPGKTEQR